MCRVTFNPNSTSNVGAELTCKPFGLWFGGCRSDNYRAVAKIKILRIVLRVMKRYASVWYLDCTLKWIYIVFTI